MTRAGVVLAGALPAGQVEELRRAVAAAERAALEDVVVVVAPPCDGVPAGLPEEVTVLRDEAPEPSEGSMLAVAVHWCQQAGHRAMVVGLAGGPQAPSSQWRAVGRAGARPIAVSSARGVRSYPVRLDAEVWPFVSTSAGGALDIARAVPALVSEVRSDADDPAALSRTAGVADGGEAAGAGGAADGAAGSGGHTGRTARDSLRVAELLGRAPRGAFEVVVRDEEGDPVVIRNSPFLDDGTPMPTRFWLVGRDLREAVSRLEAAGGVADAERALSAAAIEEAHALYAAERDAEIPADQTGPRPAGGVGGTRRGVKCLHAHLAWYLAGGPDPVGEWVARRLSLASRGQARRPAGPGGEKVRAGSDAGR
jgi:hypothetical protein